MGVISYEVGPELTDIRQALSDGGLRGDGTVSEEELVRLFETESFKQVLDRHEIDKTEALGVFNLLRNDVSGCPAMVNIDEFLIGLLYVKDTDKDMMSLWYESKQLASKMLESLVFVNSHFRDLERAIAVQHAGLQASLTTLHQDVASLK